MSKIIVSFIDDNGESIFFHNQDISRNWIETGSTENANMLIKNMFEKSNAIFANVYIIDDNNEVKNKFKVFKHREKVCY